MRPLHFEFFSQRVVQPRPVPLSSSRIACYKNGMSKYDEDIIHWSDDEDRLFDSPALSKTVDAGTIGKSEDPQSRSRARSGESPYGTEEARDAALQQELENVRKINQVIEGVVESLEKAKNNMETVSRTVNSATTLLQTWTRILSQTEHNQRLILNPAWQGATHDITELEAEEERRVREAQRRQIEEQQRREAAARKAEEDERKRQEDAAKAARGARGRGRGVGRAASSVSSSGYGQQRAGMTKGSAASSSSSRGGTGIGRGLRGRARG
ncbi:uncharacterized protein PV09_01089 [Verruconis gallopava]|uniref:DASH complex subunit DUO1 n=1 Tax=Verruconis gallopava TaxID=253628 RepID=A0A0D1XZB9_9PEZI|nr:uncharacterized protein PV09_01089 [Verruconis gallopava]KIW08156.1 hypothetical protein PV09_01089 [Verruconis gallopava]